MLTSFVLSMTLAAPVPPAPATPMVTGPAPRILELKPTDGKVMVTVVRTEKVQVGQGAAINPANPNGAAPAVITRELARAKTVELSEVKDLTVTYADGKKIETADAIKKLNADGGIVIVSTDGKAVSPMFLKMFKDDVLVLVSPELTGVNAGGATTFPGVKPLPGGGVRPLPDQPVPGIQILPAPGVQIQPGVIQIQIAPVAVPAPAPVPVPDK